LFAFVVQQISFLVHIQNTQQIMDTHPEQNDSPGGLSTQCGGWWDADVPTARKGWHLNRNRKWKRK
jgi:hypothetical protein